MKNNNVMSKIRVFIASSIELSEQRNICRAVLMKQQNLFDNIVIEAKTFEDFLDNIIEGGAQNLYNTYIACKADVVIFIFDNRVGDITMKEFQVAYNSFITKESPKIFVYIKKEERNNKEILKLKDFLNTNKQYYIEYNDDKSLEVVFENSINKYIIDKIFKDFIITDKEKLPFNLACQKLSNTLISCLSVIDQFTCVLVEVSEAWNKFLSGYKRTLSEEDKLYLKNELIGFLNHQISEVNRISKIYPPEKISISDEDIRLLALKVNTISEIKVLPNMYSSYFEDVLAPFRAIENYLLNDTLPNINKKMVELNITGFKLLADALFYISLEYLVQLPYEHQKNIKEMLLLWHNYPKNVSLNMSVEDYERLAKRMFDEFNSNIIKVDALLQIHEDDLDDLKRQIDKLKNL